MISLKLSFNMALSLSTTQFFCVDLFIVLFKYTLSFNESVDKVRSNHGTVLCCEVCRVYSAR